MSDKETVEETQPVLEPRWPNVVAAAVLSVVVGILAIPMLGGDFLAGIYSDQFATGFAFREWGADQWRATGSIPQWNPTIFGGMPFVAAMHGDIFYPTSWLRLILPTVTAMNLAFLLHYVLAGFFTYLLLRKLSVSWTAAVVGGFAYQLSGVIGSYVQPGHDGKLFVTALLPLALIALIMAIRERKFEGHALLALTVGLGVLSPHYQMVYYLLIVAGIFALYLVFGERDDRPLGSKAADLGIALGAVVLGFGVAMIQVLPFYHYIPFSPRAESYGGFERSASYGVPWSHVPELLLSGFVGDTPRGTYWGTNPLKLHSEYLGLSAVGLAVLGFLTRERRRLVVWLSIIGGLFLLVSLGSGTPFYRLWWEVMPFVKQTRAPGMALFVVALVVAMLAALGIESIEKGRRKHFLPFVVVGLVVSVLGAAGVLGATADAALGARGVVRVPPEIHGQIRLGALASGIALAIVGLGVWLKRDGRAPTAVASALFIGVVACDLGLNAMPFWDYSENHARLFESDPLIEEIANAPGEAPARVAEISQFFGAPPAYPGSALMANGVLQLLGHHGNELHAFDQLMGGKNIWNNLRSPALGRLLDLYHVDYVMVPRAVEDLESVLPDFEVSQAGVTTPWGAATTLYRRRQESEYARFVPGAVKADDEEAIHNLVLPNFPIGSVLILARDAEVDPEPLESVPEPVDVEVEVTGWAPGAISLATVANPPGYVLVSENFYPDWRAEVNGEPAPVLRADESLMAIAVGQGDNEIVLTFESDDYSLGKKISLASLLVVLVGFVAPTVIRRRSGGG